MGQLVDRVKISMKEFGPNIVDYYKNNSLFMYDSYSKTSDLCESISVTDIYPGGFYHFHYLDDSNWMRYSPVFVVDFKKFKGLIVIIALNFNFIPLELRSRIFDKYISEKNFDKNSFLEVDFKGIYMELIRIGFEYSLVEYNASQIKLAHRINLNLLPRFLYSSHPKNKYDPSKLMEIWSVKLKTKEERHQEITISSLDDFYNVEGEISEKYDLLRDHIERIKKSFQKFGNR